MDGIDPGVSRGGYWTGCHPFSTQHTYLRYLTYVA